LSGEKIKKVREILILSLLVSGMGAVNVFEGDSGVTAESKTTGNSATISNTRRIWLKNNQKEWKWRTFGESDNGNYVPTNFSPYVIQNGDSLWTISEKFRVSLGDLLKWNSIDITRTIHHGDEILVKVDQISWVFSRRYEY